MAETINGVGVGLGKQPHWKQLAFQGGGGNATVHFSAQHVRTVMAAHPTILNNLIVDYPADSPPPSGGIPDVIRVSFSGVRFTRISPPANGIVEVTLHYDSARKVAPAPVNSQSQLFINRVKTSDKAQKAVLDFIKG